MNVIIMIVLPSIVTFDTVRFYEVHHLQSNKKIGVKWPVGECTCVRKNAIDMIWGRVGKTEATHASCISDFCRKLGSVKPASQRGEDNGGFKFWKWQSRFPPYRGGNEAP